MRHRCIVLLATLLLVSSGVMATAETSTDECFSEDWGRRIAGCSAIIDSGQATSAEKSQAFAFVIMI